MFKWFTRLFKKNRACKHDWSAMQVTNYMRYKDNRRHYESVCRKCGATCDHQELLHTGAWTEVSGAPHYMVRCKVCGMSSIEKSLAKAQFYC